MVCSIKIPGKVGDNGELIAENYTLLNKWLQANKGCAIRITVEQFGNIRSNAQNRYYWGVVVYMIKERLKEIGHDLDSEEVHDFLKKEFNYKEIMTDNDYYLKIPQSTTDQSTSAFNEYIDKIKIFAAHVLGVEIPDPDINYSQTILNNNGKE